MYKCHRGTWFRSMRPKITLVDTYCEPVFEGSLFACSLDYTQSKPTFRINGRSKAFLPTPEYLLRSIFVLEHQNQVPRFSDVSDKCKAAPACSIRSEEHTSELQ